MRDTQWARTLYLEIVRISRLPFDVRAKQIPSLYRGLDKGLEPLESRRRRTSRIRLSGEYTKLVFETPEEFADRMMTKNAWLPLLEAGLALRQEQYEKHVSALSPLVQEDLHSTDSEKQLRGLRTAASIKLPNLFEDIVVLYMMPADPRITQEATNALRLMQDPRTLDRILPMLSQPPYPENYFSLLRDFSANRPAPRELVRCLDSEDRQLRREVLSVLMPSGDPALVPYVLRFVKEEDAQMRLAAAGMGLNLTGSAAKKVRPAVLKLLQDPDRRIRLNIAWKLAELKDPAAGPALLALLRDETLDEAMYLNVVQAMNTLTGSYFGYDFGDWRPTTANNRTAIAKFAEWVVAHPPRKEDM